MVKKIKLANGLRILLVPQPASLATTVLILVEAGSEYETRRINGLSHFLEHLVFKGTVNRPKPGMIAEELDSLGAEYNAFTSQQYTGYWAKAQNGKLDKILDIVSDLYLNPIFNPEEIDKEKGVIIEEINLYEDTPTRRVHDLFTTLLYGDQPAGWDIAGRKEVIRRLQRSDFLAYRSLHYVAPATTVVIAGNFNQKSIIEKAKKLFSAFRKGRKPGKSGVRERQTKPNILVKFKKSDQSHFLLGTRAFPVADKRRYALHVLADVLGGGMSSRLFRRVREELGAAYYIRASTELLLDHGHFAVAAGVDHKKIQPVIAIVLEEFGRLAKERVDKRELQKAKDHLSGNLILGLESSDELAGFYGEQEILTRTLVPPEKLIAEVQGVTAEEIKKVARTLFTNAKLNLAVIGPYKRPLPFKKIFKL